MKLARLLLQAFGPFTDVELDFIGKGGPAAANLHLIYGPNEAGKSSALRAMTDLRFGIPQRSPDDFVHASGDLRIGGVFIDSTGEPIGLVRRKGRGATLARFDVATGQTDPVLPVRPEHELALTGGLERSEFESLFGLSHVRLREGGNQLLRGEGELGSALFEASAGTRGIAALLATLDEDARKLFNPHVRTQNAVINEARRQFDEQRHAWRQAQIRPAEWQTLNRAHEEASTAVAELTKALEDLRRRESGLTELRTVEPILRDHDRAAAELQSLEAIPDLAEDARERRLATEQALRRVQQDLRDADAELARCADSLDALVIEPLVLEHADAIERLTAAAEAAARSRIEVQQQETVVSQIEKDLAVSAARLAPGREIGEILQALPSSADRIALDAHINEAGRLNERLDGYRQRAEELNCASMSDAARVETLPDPIVRQALVEAVEQAQSFGDATRQHAESDRQIQELERQLTQELSELGSDSELSLRSAQPLLEAEIARARQELTAIDDAVSRARVEDQRLAHDVEGQRLRQRQLASLGEVVTAETMRLARARRDEGWTLIRHAYVERTHDGDQLARDFDPARSLPDAFEAAQSEADRQADLLRADASRAASFAECSGRIEEMEARRHELKSELAELGARSADLRAAWTQRLAQSRLPCLEPDALREWQNRRVGALTLADRLVTLRADRDRALKELSAAASGISSALIALGQPVPSHSAGEPRALQPLIEQAVRWERLAMHAQAERTARAETARERQVEREKILGLIADTERNLQRHVTALREWHARLFLPADSLPNAVKARLAELDELQRQSSEMNAVRLRQAHHQVVLDDMASQAVRLVRLLHEPAPDAVDDFADQLRKRLATCRLISQERAALARDRTRAQEKKRIAETEQLTLAETQRQLCAAAGVGTVGQLPQLEEATARKREVQKILATLRQQLEKASTHSKDELRVSLSGMDAFAVEAERERCREEIERHEQKQAAARRAEEEARHALEAVDASDRAATAREAMESAAARYRAAIRPWARLRLARALLQEALDRFRERAQAPMVAAATTYFSLMTGGRYVRLVTDEADDRPVLRAERSDGRRIGVEAMSEGTADQLYLALRLAALELRRASHPQMPLILDDALITSDDQRAANVLRALVQFSRGGQVMLFTHHQHLNEVARVAVGNSAIALHTL